MTSAELERQIEVLLRDLGRELGESIPAAEVSLVGRAYYEALCRDAVVNDFIPLLVYRHTREALTRSTRDELHDAA